MRVTVYLSILNQSCLKDKRMLDSSQAPSFLKTIADEVRWQLLKMLSDSDYRVQELVGMLSQPQNLVSYHLKKLKELHLVNERRSTADARDVYYTLDFNQLRALYIAAGEALHPGLLTSVEKDLVVSMSGESARILILCTENSARSQMAEALIREMGGSGIEVMSAGTKPTNVHPMAIQTMAALNIDIRGQRAKSVDEFVGQPFDYVITVCDRAKEVCPQFPQAVRLVHWSLADPAAVEDADAQKQAFEEISNQLVTRVRHLLMVINHNKQSKEIKS